MSAETAGDWDAGTYDRVSDIQFNWALEQLQRFELRGDEVVLDAGCGSGRVMARLLDMAPQGHVYGVDVSPSMVAHATRALGKRATVLCQDLVDLDLPEPVDVIFSNATFHWILDHDGLFASLHRALAPGGRLVAQCGGMGNIDRFRRTAEAVAGEQPYAAYFEDWRSPWNYATDTDTAARLARAGFTEVRCWLEPKPVTPPEPHAFVQTVCLLRHLVPLPEDLHVPFIEEVLRRMGSPLVLDYVRLNITAGKHPAG